MVRPLEKGRCNDSPSFIVSRLPTRTARPHGISGPEINRLNGAVRFMSLHCPRWGRLWWASLNKGSNRDLIADVQKRITKLQAQNALPLYNVTVFEISGALHAHFAFIGNPDIVSRLRHSAAFGHLLEIQPVTNARGLTCNYHAKERTPQAGYRRSHLLGGRRPGSHKLPGGGDRVRLSRELERDAIEAEYVEPWLHTNAKRSAERKAYRLRRLEPRKAPRPAGQLPLLPEIERPVSRLHDFGGGFIPHAVAIEIEFRRRRLGLSQRQLALSIGRSQGQFANALRGHDPISVRSVNRLRDVFAGRLTCGEGVPGNRHSGVFVAGETNGR
jgi:hypothetical protein